MRNQLHRRLLALGVWLLLPVCGWACDCAYPGAPCKAFANTPTVFAGRVTKISTINRHTQSGDNYNDRLVFFEVERSYRGWNANTAEVVTGWGGGDCGYDFREGVRYLVYAYPHPETGKLYTGICQRTRRVSEASEDIEYLMKKDDPGHGAGIEGTIEELDSKNRTSVVDFLEGISVLISGPSGRQTIVSQKNGQFRLWGLLPGRYRVTPLLPKSFVPVEQDVNVKKNACVEVRFLATLRTQSWHLAFQGLLARVEVNRTLYERRKDEDCLIAVRITSMANRAIGVDLRKFWNVIYPNSWGFSKTPAPELVDEERIIRQTISAAEKQELILDYSEKHLATILPHRSLTYLRAFTIGRNIREEIESAAKQYLIIGLDGALELTDGRTTEEMIFEADDDMGVSGTRWVVIRLPATWATVPHNSLVVEPLR